MIEMPRDPAQLAEAQHVYRAEREAYDHLVATRRAVLGEKGGGRGDGRLAEAGERWIRAAVAAWTHDKAPERLVDQPTFTERRSVK